MALSHDVAAAYSTTGEAWQRGPARIYDRLAEVLADACPVPLAAASVLDLGAGTGAAGRAARRRGAAFVVALDIAVGMLDAERTVGQAPVAADALTLPFAAGSFDVVVAAFSLNHVTRPEAALRQAARVLRPSGGLVVGAYACDDHHPARDAAHAAAAARGWRRPPWYGALQTQATPMLATVERARRVARAAGLADVVVSHWRVPFPDLGADDLVAWRMGMADLAPFVATLPPDEREALAADAAARLDGAPPLVRSVIVLSARARPPAR